MDEVKITLLANAAVLLSFPEVQFLVDGLYLREEVENTPFDPVPQPLMEQLFSGARPLGGIDYLLATHDHPDHFSRRAAAAYLEGNPVKGLILPACAAGEPLAGTLEKKGVPTMGLALSRGESRQFRLEGGLSLTAGNTGHLGADFAQVEHYSYLLEGHGRRVLITGDTDVDGTPKDTFGRMTGGAPVDVALVTPLFFRAGQKENILLASAAPRRTLIYHVPFEADAMGIRRRTLRLLERHREDPFPLEALMEPMQAISL